MKRFLTATILWLAAAASAFAQVPYFPQTLPGHTVVGRLSASAGTTEAIPFASLSSQILFPGFYNASFYANIQAAVNAAAVTGGTVVVPSSMSSAAPTSVPVGVVIMDLRNGTGVAGSLAESPFSLIGRNTAARAALQVINPSAIVRSTFTFGDTLKTGDTATEMTPVGIYASTSKANTTSIGIFAFADTTISNSAAFGANFGVGNASGQDSSITGMELDIDNNYSGGGVSSKIGLVINAFNNPISSAISINGANGGGFTNGILFLAGTAPSSGAGSLIAVNAQTNKPSYAMDLSQTGGFLNGAINIANGSAGGNWIQWIGTASAHAKIFNSSGNVFTFRGGSSGYGLQNNAGTVTLLSLTDAGIASLTPGAADASLKLVNTGSHNPSLYMYDTTDGGNLIFSAGGILKISTLSVAGAFVADTVYFKADNTVQFAAASIIANNTVATAMTNVGPTGSHTTVQEWLQVRNSSGTMRYIPMF